MQFFKRLHLAELTYFGYLSDYFYYLMRLFIELMHFIGIIVTQTLQRLILTFPNFPLLLLPSTLLFLGNPPPLPPILERPHGHPLPAPLTTPIPFVPLHKRTHLPNLLISHLH
jgi:hypothetical protein